MCHIKYHLYVVMVLMTCAADDDTYDPCMCITLSGHDIRIILHTYVANVYV